jgi:hypothetical protein
MGLLGKPPTSVGFRAEPARLFEMASCHYPAKKAEIRGFSFLRMTGFFWTVVAMGVALSPVVRFS